MKRLLLFLLLCFAIFFIIRCASQGPPPGGPEDKKPPEIIDTFPKPDTTNVNRDVKIIIEFNESVDPFSCQESIFITPFPGEKVKYSWKRDRKLTIDVGDSLMPNRTYIVTIGAGTKDRRNNMMKDSYTLAFSTGDYLDFGEIRGIVYGEQVEGTQMWAYDLADKSEPNPAEDFPLYITQIGKDGLYALIYLALGNYRIFAVKDRDVNNQYNAEYDMLGMTHKDVVLDSTNWRMSMLNFRIALRDTTPPMLDAAFAPDNKHVDLRFTEKMLIDSLSLLSNYSITAENDTLAVLNAMMDKYNERIIHLDTEVQKEDTEYLISVKQAWDLNYLPLVSDSNFAFFNTSSIPDTNRPYYITMLPKDSSQFVLLDSQFEIVFSEALLNKPFESFFIMADTLGDTLSGEIFWNNKAAPVFKPKEKLKSETYYLLTLPVDSVADLAGNTLQDTLFQKWIISVNPDTLTEISGKMTDADTSAVGAFFLRARSTDEKKGASYDLWIKNQGNYRFENMLPGKYIIEVFRDEDNNGRYTWGDAFPYAPAERYYVYPDTIEIRSRWPDEGEDILLPD